MGETAILEKEYPDKVCMKQVGVVLEDGDVGQEDNLKMPIFTYTLQPGVSKGSYGINCAKITGIPNEVIKIAAVNSKSMDKVSRAIQYFDFNMLDELEGILENGNLSNFEKKSQIFGKLGPELVQILS